MIKRESKQQGQIEHITITKCLSEPCAIFYTDALSQSILIECRNPKHKDTDNEKVEERIRLPASPNLNQQTQQPEDRKDGDVT